MIKQAIGYNDNKGTPIHIGDILHDIDGKQYKVTWEHSGLCVGFEIDNYAFNLTAMQECMQCEDIFNYLTVVAEEDKGCDILDFKVIQSDHTTKAQQS